MRRQIFKATFAPLLIPSDREPFLKLIHRTLYTGPRGSRTCPRCKCTELRLTHFLLCRSLSPIFKLAFQLISILEGKPFNPLPAMANSNSKRTLRNLAQAILGFRYSAGLTAPTALKPGSMAILALAWRQAYQLTTRQAIERERHLRSRPNSTPASPIHPSLQEADTDFACTNLINTLHTRITGLALKTNHHTQLSNALNVPYNPKNTLSKASGNLASIDSMNTIVLHGGVAELLATSSLPSFTPIPLTSLSHASNSESPSDA